MRLAAVPRTVVRGGLRGLRLPLDATERAGRALGVHVDEEWFPLRVFGSFEADSKRVLGALVGDDALVDEGRRQRARSEELRQAHVLRVGAQRTRTEADVRGERHHEAAIQQHEAIDDAARATARRGAAERAAEREEVRRQARREAEMADGADEVRRDRARRVQRQARATRVVEEGAVLRLERQAVEAEEEAERLGRGADAKAQRG